ncbi:somatostatin receptor type 2-like protein [Leptotrombidium deliense]|uniref:Somatostatin receptor type 2-like protein n=1 Tax=Leptotrombidium deliense TaxID=299467 RepID=A0A443S5Z3_9ACAR|nr:somatostatin receptor type 2-like protein [Leptotrombidium deliense]
MDVLLNNQTMFNESTNYHSIMASNSTIYESAVVNETTSNQCIDRIEFLELNWIFREPLYDNNSMYYRILMMKESDPERFESLMNVGIISGYLITFSSIWGILSNMFVLYVVLFVAKPMAINNLFISSLAIADTLVVLVNGPISAVQLIVGDWLFHVWLGNIVSEILCKAFHFTYTFAVGMSGYTLVIMSIERFLGVYYPMQTKPYRTIKNAMKPLYFIYIAGIVLMFPTVFYSTVLQTPSGCYRCYVGWVIKDFRIISWIDFIIGYMGPVFFISLFNVLILVKIIKRSKRRNLSAQIDRKKQRSNTKSWVMILLIIFFYLICWFPFECLYIMEICIRQCPKRILKQILPPEYLILGYVLSFFNSCINPIIYSLLSENFQNACKKLSIFKSVKGSKTKMLRRNSPADQSV